MFLCSPHMLYHRFSENFYLSCCWFFSTFLKSPQPWFWEPVLSPRQPVLGKQRLVGAKAVESRASPFIVTWSLIEASFLLVIHTCTLEFLFESMNSGLYRSKRVADVFLILKHSYLSSTRSLPLNLTSHSLNIFPSSFFTYMSLSRHIQNYVITVVKKG
jgi:hypothetical protein